MKTEIDVGTKLIGTIIATPIIAVLLIIAMLVDGFVFLQLWNWFFIPIFHLPVLTLAMAIGISMTIGFVVRPISRYEGKLDIGATLKNIFLAPFLTLLVGYILHYFFM